MQTAEIRDAARLLARSWRTGKPLPRLPEACRPRDGLEAMAIQRALLDELGEAIVGYKVALSPDHGVLMGLIVGSRLFASGAAIDTRLFNMRGVEAEVAFRCEAALPVRGRDYSASEVAEAVTALPAIEIVDTRFTSYDATPSIERVADFMSNGALVYGEPPADWREVRFSELEAYVEIDGSEIVRKSGGHPTGAPLAAATALVNALRLSTGLRAGMVVTTGSYVGMPLAAEKNRIEAGFEGFGSVRCVLD